VGGLAEAFGSIWKHLEEIGSSRKHLEESAALDESDIILSTFYRKVIQGKNEIE
jgi:hypothetical protein